ncbi:MAG: glycosyltransferase, partial [Acidobacteriota bacterium]
FAPPPERREGAVLRCIGGGVWQRDYTAFLRTAELLAGDGGFEFHLVSPDLGSARVPAGVALHRGLGDGELVALYRSCDLVFLPLLDATSNNFLLEGAACGLPIVSSDLPGVRFHFPGPEAELVDGNRPKAFAAVLRELAGKPERRRAMGAAARQRALRFGWKTLAREYERAYLGE